MSEIGEIKKAREIGRMGWNKFIWHSCEDCGHERWVLFVKGKADRERCPKCAHVGNFNGRWKGGKIERECLGCGKTFHVKPSKLNYSRGRFCSRICGILFNRKANVFGQSPNNPEQVFIQLCHKNDWPFRYVGNGEVWLGNRNPDFINTNGHKQIIELLGEYWHPLFDGASRTEHYKQYGFDCLVIWNDELKDTNRVAERVRKFMRS